MKPINTSGILRIVALLVHKYRGGEIDPEWEDSEDAIRCVLKALGIGDNFTLFEYKRIKTLVEDAYEMRCDGISPLTGQGDVD
jgi:hypothetical protein